MSPRNFHKQMSSPHFHTRHTDAPRPDLEMERAIENFFKTIIKFLTFSRFFKN